MLLSEKCTAPAHPRLCGTTSPEHAKIANRIRNIAATFRRKKGSGKIIWPLLVLDIRTFETQCATFLISAAHWKLQQFPAGEIRNR